MQSKTLEALDPGNGHLPLSVLYFKLAISIGNYTVREVLMKNRTSVWRNVYNTASA